MVDAWLCFLWWIRHNAEEIVAISTALAAIGALGALVAVYLAYRQLRDARLALQASNTYEIQKEARETMAELMKNDDFHNYMFATPPTDEAAIRQAETRLGLMFNFYLSVYRQALAGGISDKFVRSLAKDFCQFIKMGKTEAFFNRKKADKTYDEEYDQMLSYWQKKAV